MADLSRLNKTELQEKCIELEIEFVEDDTKAELIAKIESVDVSDQEFDIQAYERVAFLTLDAKRRKGGRLSETEEKELKELKPIAYKNKGRTPIVTDTYKVAHKTIRLVEGLPTPESVFLMFSKYGQENLFS